MIRICTSIEPDWTEVAGLLKEDFKTGQLSNFGPCYEKLCEELSIFLNLPSDKRIVLTSSGHTALMAAYAMTGGTYVFGPAYTFPSTWLAAAANWMVASIECEYIPYDKVDDVPRDIYSDTSLSVVTPLSIIPNLEFIDNEWGEIPIVIDGAPSFGTPDIYGYGNFYCLSFHATKTFPLGEGGAVICDKSEEPYVRRYINFGMSKSKLVLDISAINGKLSEYTCAIGLSILPKMKEVIERRLENAAIYKELLGDLVPESWTGDKTVYQVFPIYLPSAAAAKRVRKTLNQAHIQNLQYYRPYFSLPGAQRKYDTNVCLPVHQDLTPKQIRHISQVILSV